MSAARDEVALEASQDWPVPWEPVEGDRSGPLAYGTSLAVRGVIGLLAALPWSMQRALARLLGKLGPLVDRRHAAEGLRFVEAAYPDLPSARCKALVAHGFESLVSLTLEGVGFERAVPPERRFEHFEVKTTPDLERVIAQRRGALILTAHVGAWEFLPMVTARLGFQPCYVVSRPPRNRPLSRFAQRLRESRGFRLLHRHGAASSIPKVIAAGGYVGLMVDQRARRKTIVAPFFGRPAHCERAVAVFARRLGVPVVFAACYRTERRWRYQVEFPRVLWPDELSRLSPEAITARINAELERMIRAHPEQYFWLHDRYRGAPADERVA